ncbi:MAG: type I pullulanase [Senegalia sp. (in: firmicutes)]|uniref:type I pullulanase n=1 Tax=Senegalia sp. (in: firmicutes) TaxID=1924098 RepID=UPI003F98DE54
MDYNSTDKKLGLIYNEDKTIVRVWSPQKEEIKLIIYPGYKTLDREIFKMKKCPDGVHEYELIGDYNGYFYTFLIDDEYEVTDPYSISSSPNSKRSAIINLKDTNPHGFKDHLSPDIKICDAIIYEVHIKDFTINTDSEYRGKYLGFKSKIPHLKELGVSHIHLMPIFDFLTVNEESYDFYRDDNYNWGYDPELYNVPEGSYASKPEDPINRIKELKELIMTLHNEGFKVVMDVVYNHTYKSYDSNFNRIMPGYYYRMNGHGRFSNGSGVGNELASERPMVRKFIINSLLYWQDEYKIDGFRFDLMALTDIDTIEKSIKRLRKKDPDVLIYGEPWMGGASILESHKHTIKGSQQNLSFAFFNDRLRNSIKGDNDGSHPGFVGGNSVLQLDVETGIVGSIDYDNLHIGFTSHPNESINYINSHDNLIIYDKFKKSFPNMANEDIERLNKLAFSIVFTAQGIPFFHEGNEFLRTKQMDHNSYKSNTSLNALDWTLKEKNKDFYDYFKDLISLRKSHDEFRLCSEIKIKEKLKFFHYKKAQNVIVYTIKNNDSYLLVVHNANFFSAYLDEQDLNFHIKNCYKQNKREFFISTILDEKGMKKDRAYTSLKNKKIEVPYLSTGVFVLR